MFNLISPFTDPSLPDAPEPTVSSNYVTMLNDSFKAVTQPRTWDAANKHCEGDGAILATLQNEWSQIYVELLALTFNTSMWIGMNKAQVQGRKPFKLKLVVLPSQLVPASG